jgi:benzoate 4-monooxygenase
MELACIVATTFRNFEFRDEHVGEMQTREGFLRKPLGFDVGIRRRD